MSEKKSLTRRAIDGITTRQFWLVAICVYAIARIPTWFFPYDSDHWIFYYVGKHWFGGDILYLQVWDHKAPLIFAINGAMHTLLGDNIVLHRLLFTALSVLSIWVFYCVAKRVFTLTKNKLIERDARVATLFFIFWANLSQFTNSGNNTENFGVLALLIALYCYLRWIDNRHWKWLLYSGVGVSLLVFLKLNFAILLLPLIIDFIMRMKQNWLALVGAATIWIAPLLLQGLLWYSYFAPRNMLEELWIASVSFNGKYLRSGWAGNLSGQTVFLLILGVAAIFFVGAYAVAWKHRRDRTKGFITLLALTSVVFSIILGTFYSHYYLIVIPYATVVAGAYWSIWTKSRIWIVMAVIAMCGSLAISYKQLYNNFFGPAHTDMVAMQTAADAIQELTEPGDKIFFYGYGATFYQMSGRDSGSRYISASHLLIDEREGFGYDFTNKFIGDMEISEPAYVVIDKGTIDIYDDNKKAMSYFDNHYKYYLSIGNYEFLRRNQ